MRKLICCRRAGALFAVYIAYTLAIEAVMASVGLGMSAFAAPGQATLVLCSLADGLTIDAPAKTGDRQNQTPRPQCPFCFVAAQSVGHVATAGEPPVFPAYVGSRVIGALSDHCRDKVFPPRPRRTVGDPRAPPAFSV